MAALQEGLIYLAHPFILVLRGGLQNTVMMVATTTENTGPNSKDGQGGGAGPGVFSLAQAAACRITQLLADEPAGSFFRVAVLGGGCSGFQYDFSIDQSRHTDDICFTSFGVDVVVDEISLELVDHAELDYVQDLMGSYFAVNNPNATASCGCGTSFSV